MSKPLTDTFSIVITPLDDSIVEAAETVVVTIQPNVSYDVGAAFSASITIDDKTSPTSGLITYTVKATDFIAVESVTSGGYADPAVFTVTRTGSILSPTNIYYSNPPSGAPTYSYSGPSPTATVGIDYNAAPATPGPIDFPAGVSTRTVVITPLWEANKDQRENITLTVNYAGNSSSTNVYLYDPQDAAPVPISVSTTTPLATEGGATATFTFTRTSSKGLQPVVFRLDGQANLETDYTLTGTSFITIPIPPSSSRARQTDFQDGNLTTTVTLTPANDSTAEGIESVIITIIQPSYTIYYQIGSPRQVALRIRDSASITDYVPDTDNDGINDVAEIAGSPPTDPLLWDTDGDGLPDGFFANQSLDSDGDGISNASEGALTIVKTDSDGDGISDFKELLLGLNPFVANTITDTQAPAITVTYPTSPKVTLLP